MNEEDRISIPRSKLREAVTKLNDILRILRGDNQCSACRFWSGSCQKGKVNRVAADVACELFESRGGK